MTEMRGVPSAIIGIVMIVIPAKAGIHATLTGWIPACAGMTAEGWGGWLSEPAIGVWQLAIVNPLRPA